MQWFDIILDKNIKLFDIPLRGTSKSFNVTISELPIRVNVGASNSLLLLHSVLSTYQYMINASNAVTVLHSQCNNILKTIFNQVQTKTVLDSQSITGVQLRKVLSALSNELRFDSTVSATSVSAAHPMMAWARLSQVDIDGVEKVTHPAVRYDATLQTTSDSHAQKSVDVTLNTMLSQDIHTAYINFISGDRNDLTLSDGVNSIYHTRLRLLGEMDANESENNALGHFDSMRLEDIDYVIL